jgi:hypothetical protein
MYKMNETDADGGIVTFTATHPKWSFAKIDEKGLVTEVAEKKPISTNATVGVYYWKHGSDFVKYAEEMIEQDIRVNNEFYICPVYNNAINDNKQIRTFEIEKMWGLGDPQSFDIFINKYKPNENQYEKCNVCKTNLSLDKFYNNKNSKDNLDNKCKTCSKAYREKHKERNSKKIKSWHKENKEDLREYYKQRYQENKEYYKKIAKKNKEKIKIQAKGRYQKKV